MPTKVCLDCEEKLVSFQLFILECYKAQDSLRLILLDQSRQFDIKLEDSDDSVDFGLEVKSEVKMCIVLNYISKMLIIFILFFKTNI